MIFCVKHLQIKKNLAFELGGASTKTKLSSIEEKLAFFPRKSLEMLPQLAKLHYQFSVEFRLQRVFRV